MIIIILYYSKLNKNNIPNIFFISGLDALRKFNNS
jgi:hypothetical protein